MMKLPWTRLPVAEPPPIVPIHADDLRAMLADVRDMQLAINDRLIRVETRLCALMKYHNVPTHVESRVIAHRVRETSHGE
jgi:hypothetical protein